MKLKEFINVYCQDIIAGKEEMKRNETDFPPYDGLEQRADGSGTDKVIYFGNETIPILDIIENDIDSYRKIHPTVN